MLFLLDTHVSVNTNAVLGGGLDGGREEKLITRKKPIKNLVILGSVYWCTFCR